MNYHSALCSGHRWLLKWWGIFFIGLLGANSLGFADSPPLPGVRIFAIDRQASEAGPDIGVFVVMRTGSTAEDLTAFYSVDGSADEGLDFQALPGYVTIPSGFASAFIVVNPIDDLEIEDRVGARRAYPGPAVATDAVGWQCRWRGSRLRDLPAGS